MRIAMLFLFVLGCGVAAGAVDSIRVEQAESKWVISGDERVVTVGKDFSIAVKTPASTWSLSASDGHDLAIDDGPRKLTLRLSEAQTSNVSEFHDGVRGGVRIRLAQWMHDGRPLDLKIDLYVCLDEPTKDLVFDIVATEGAAKVRE